jgi:hypothetical protein
MTDIRCADTLALIEATLLIVWIFSHDIHRYYVDLHSRARAYRKLVQRLNSQKIKQGKKPRAGDRVEMNNFQEPQVRHIRPLVVLDYNIRHSAFK